MPAMAQLLVPEDLQLTLEQFAALCQANPDAVLKRDASGRLIPMPPTGSETGARSGKLLILLALAVHAPGRPLKLDAGSLFPGLKIDLQKVWVV